MAADLAEGARAGNPGRDASAWQAPEIRNFPRVAQVCKRVIRNAVIKRLKALFREAAGDPGNDTEFDELQLATAALMVEAAGLDDDFAPEERQVIVGLLARRFGLSEDSAQSLIAAAEARLAEAGHLQSFTRVVKGSFDAEERIALLQMLWEVVYADGRLHDYEASLMRRLAGLLHVPDRASGAARKRALEELGLDDSDL